MDDIRLYLEPENGVQSFYSLNDIRPYALVGYTTNNESDLINHVTNNLTLREIYESIIQGLEGRIGEDYVRANDIFDVKKK